MQAVTGNLKLVILNTWRLDHAGNCAYIQGKFGAKIAMHYDDAGMVHTKDMTWSRKNKPSRISILGRLIMLISKAIGGSDKFDVFNPDIYIAVGPKAV